MRTIISFIARTLYRDQCQDLKEKLCAVYSKLEIIENTYQTEIITRLLISGEDHRFKYHFGFDLIAIIRAIKNRIIYNRIEGASTIAQQLVRVITNDYKPTLRRKIREILLSTTLKDFVPWRKIPIIYLHVAYFGANMNGLAQALKRLKPIDQDILTEDLAAEIVSRIKYPEPKLFNKNRATQIENRKTHLLRLYNKHIIRRIITIYG